MPPPLKAWTPAKAQAEGCGSITNFFKPPPPVPRGPGRPQGSRNKKRGRPAAASEPSPPATAAVARSPSPSAAPLAAPAAAAGWSSPEQTCAAPASAAAQKPAAAKVASKPKATRINWSQGEMLERMQRAVGEYLNKEGRWLSEPDMSITRFCALVEIPEFTFRKYVGGSEDKRRVLGASVGAPALLDADIEQFSVDVLRRRDRGNDGMDKREAVDMINDLRPSLSRKQCENAFDALRQKHKEELTGIVKAQATTTKRSAITVPQQFRWHQTIDSGYQFLRDHNVGTNPQGQTFGEVMPHYIIGGDETCLQASAGDVQIIGDKEKRKHEKETANSRTSITLYRTGSAAGADGPTAFLPPGVRCKTGYTDDFLERHGAAPGSTIAMTATGYMTTEAWVELAPKIASGIRRLPMIKDTPDWWTLKIIDGFGAHTSSLEAMEIYAAQKILLVKEEGDSSHVNQAYDQQVAKEDKKSMRTALAFLRSTSKITKSVVDGWQLVHVGLAAVRALDADSWVKSFTKVNLHPHHRVDFPSWCKRISHFLQGGESFKSEGGGVLDTYLLLPSFWHGMLPDEKKSAMAILAKHSSAFSVACIKELHAMVHVPYADMQNLRVCLELAVAEPSHLERGVPEAATVASAVPKPVADAQAAQADVAAGLVSFQLHPKKPDGSQLFSGMAKFNHLAKTARRSTPECETLRPSAYLDIEMTAVQQRLLDPKPVDFAVHAIARHCHGEDAKQKIAKRKIDALGNLRGESSFANDEARLKRLKNQLQLCESLAVIDKETATEKETKASQATAELVDKAPAALDKLKEKGNDVAKLTMPEICAIAFAKFNGASLKGKKEDLIKGLQSLIAKQPAVLNLGAQPALAAPAPPALAAPAPDPLALPNATVVAVDGKPTLPLLPSC